MSKIKVNEIEKASGSGITIPTGTTFTVTDGIPATNLSGTIADARLPTVPVAKGGTGVTSLGTANQVLAVNSGASALEFQDASSGKIGQVISTTKTDGFTANLSGAAQIAITGLSCQITPSATSSKILVWYSIQTAQGDGAWQYCHVQRDSTKIGVGDQVGSNRNRVSTFGYHGDGGNGDANNNHAFQFLDTPNTTSAITYQCYLNNGAGSTVNNFKININNSNDAASRATFASSITVMEILA
tara:strand:- start:469 stop:1197 length:729 start_codon:yes stop_codon:yes gene_type:complete